MCIAARLWAWEIPRGLGSRKATPRLPCRFRLTLPLFGLCTPLAHLSEGFLPPSAPYCGARPMALLADTKYTGALVLVRPRSCGSCDTAQRQKHGSHVGFINAARQPCRTRLAGPGPGPSAACIREGLRRRLHRRPAEKQLAKMRTTCYQIDIFPRADVRPAEWLA